MDSNAHDDGRSGTAGICFPYCYWKSPASLSASKLSLASSESSDVFLDAWGDSGLDSRTSLAGVGIEPNTRSVRSESTNH